MMRVRCISDYVTPEQRAALGRREYRGSLGIGLTIGQEYLALGLAFETDPEQLSTGPYVTILHEIHGPKTFDLCLFEITDPRASRYWEVRTSQFEGSHIVELLPPALFAILNADTSDMRTGEEQDAAYFAALASESYRQIIELMRSEFTS